MSTNPTVEQTVYQRRHRAKKKAAGLCRENGCHNETTNYRCVVCHERKKEREARRA